MSIGLLKKSIIAYKPIFIWNILASSLISVFFKLNGFEDPGFYSLAIFLKLIGWAFSIGLYVMFYKPTAYFFNNQGISFKQIMANLVLYDTVIFIIILNVIFLCQSFL